MGRSLLAALLLVVLFLSLALIIVMFGIVPELTDLTQGPTPRPVVLTPRPGILLSPAVPRPQATRPSGAATAGPVGETPAPVTLAPSATLPGLVRPGRGRASPTADPTAAAQARAGLEKMLQSEAAGVRYRFITLATYGLEPARGEIGQITLRVEGEVDGQNVRQVLGSAERLPESQLSQIEMRTVDGVTYLYANQQWQIAAGNPTDAQQRFFQQPVNLEDASLRLELVGVEQLADVPVPTYRYRINAPTGQMPLVPAPADVPQGNVQAIVAQQNGYLWVGTDGRRYRLEYSIRLGVPQGEMTAGWELVTRYYAYDDPTIRVEAPEGVTPGGG
jgi:hypothetical protein